MTQNSLFDTTPLSAPFDYDPPPRSRRRPAPLETNPAPDWKPDEGERLKQEGMKRAADRQHVLLERARGIAGRIAGNRGEVTADDVARELGDADTLKLGNAWGSVFRYGFVHTGEWRKSERVSNHSRMNRVWRMR